MERKLAAAGLLAGGAWFAWRNRSGADLSGRVALVTGGSRGLGFLLAEELLRQGCSVAICARDRVALDRARTELRQRAGPGANVLALACDVTDRAAVAEMVDRVVDTYGRLDVVINNASTIQVAPLTMMTRADFEEAVNITFWGALNTTFAALPHLHRTGGRIANITSIGAKVPIPHLLPYGVGKFALIAFSEGLRIELAGSGVTVTTVVPGLMRTGSPRHVRYAGNAAAEYAWFTAGDVTPVTAMSAIRAASAIIAAIRRGDAEIVLTWQAKLLRLAHALAPGTITRVLGVVNRLLPPSPHPLSGGGPADSDDGEDAGTVPRSNPDVPGDHPPPEQWVRGRDLPEALPGPIERALDRSGRPSNQ